MGKFNHPIILLSYIKPHYTELKLNCNFKVGSSAVQSSSHYPPMAIQIQILFN